jgi:hypothetical protein
MNQVWVFILWCLILLSCAGEPNLSESNPKILETLEKRKALYRKEVLENCKRDMMERANLYVDSLIAAEISYQLSDSIVFPPKPLKPGSPGPIIIRDTVKARPVW